MIRTTLAGGRGWLDAPAAASLARMDADYGGRLPTTSTGRLRWEQEEAYRKYLAGGSYAAKPGQSPHEFGNAVDFHNHAWMWLLAHAEDHGWYLTIKSEPWHRVYYQNRDNHLGGSPAGIPQKGFLMTLDNEQQNDLAMRVESTAQAVARIEQVLAGLFRRGGLDQNQENDIYMRVESIAQAVARMELEDE